MSIRHTASPNDRLEFTQKVENSILAIGTLTVWKDNRRGASASALIERPYQKSDDGCGDEGAKCRMRKLISQLTVRLFFFLSTIIRFFCFL